MAYPPGSFTKNFGWGKDKGFKKLHDAVRLGFKNKPMPVSRQEWRKDSKLSSDDFLIASNFFLCNLIRANQNYVAVDELVYQALTQPHSSAFDRLALFALNLSLVGRRIGSTNGVEFPIKWANEFVRERLWVSGRWTRDALEEIAMDGFLQDRIDGEREGIKKCRTNYRRLYELTNFLPAQNKQINTDVDMWGPQALFLAWDRRTLCSGIASSRDELVQNSLLNEDFKLFGLTKPEFDLLLKPAAKHYQDLGGLGRFEDAFTQEEFISTPTRALKLKKTLLQETKPELIWLDRLLKDEAVERTIRQRLTQKRNQILATKIKVAYNYTCMACNVKLVDNNDPLHFYAEAAHIKAIGEPFNGPDKAFNMLVLCPNHHVQFDRGILSVIARGEGYHFVSRIEDDPIHGKEIPLQNNHKLDRSCIDWHYSYLFLSKE
jgi:hypothetical protein